MRPHALARGRQAACGGVWRAVFRRVFLRRVDRLHAPRNLRFLAGEELAGKSHRRQGDLTTATRRFDGRGFRKENKVTERKHDHKKKKRFSLLALIPCEEKKGRIPNFYYIHGKNLLLYYILDLYIFTCSWVPQYSKKIKGKDCTISNNIYIIFFFIFIQLVHQEFYWTVSFFGATSRIKICLLKIQV